MLDDATLTITQGELTELHYTLLQLVRVMNFLQTAGDAEYLYRVKLTALGQLDDQLARILIARH